MGGICYRKNNERGLWFEIKCTEDVIRNKKKRGEDCKHEKKVLKSLQKLTEGDYSNQADSREK